jgi:hypothetical protein
LKELELKIVVYLDTQLRWADACSSCGITPAQRDGLRNWLETTEIMVKGQNVKVKVVFKWEATCQCTKSIELLVKDMATKKILV